MMSSSDKPSSCEMERVVPGSLETGNSLGSPRVLSRGASNRSVDGGRIGTQGLIPGIGFFLFQD